MIIDIEVVHQFKTIIGHQGVQAMDTCSNDSWPSAADTSPQ